jgi:hypothetical protein
MDKNAIEKMAKAIDGYRDDVIRLQTELCKRPALGPDNEGDGEIEKVEFLKEYLASIGFSDIQQYNAPDKRVPSGYRPNVVALLPGRQKSPRVWIMTHTDVVPPGDLSKWTGDPWVLRVDGDKVIGRGTEDNQQGMVSSLLAAKAFKDTGVAPNLPYGLILCADEETGNEYGVRYLLEKHKSLFSKDDLIIIPDAGDHKGTMIEVAEKSILWIRLHTRGKQTHLRSHKKGSQRSERQHDPRGGRFLRRLPGASGVQTERREEGSADGGSGDGETLQGQDRGGLPADGNRCSTHATRCAGCHGDRASDQGSAQAKAEAHGNRWGNCRQVLPRRRLLLCCMGNPG